MAILRMKQIREMKEAELNEKMKELKLELSKERASGEIGGTVKNPGRIREIRKTVARILTSRKQKNIPLKGKTQTREETGKPN